MENKNNKFIDPEKIIGQLDIKFGSKVADFGCGTGYFSFPLSRKVGERGLVYALDVLPQIIEAIESEAKLTNIKNIVTRRVNLEKEGGSKLETESLDWVILKDVLYQNQKKDILLREAKRVLKKEGKILVVEWAKGEKIIGPEESLRVEKNDVLELGKKENLEFFADIEAGKFHWGFILIK